MIWAHLLPVILLYDTFFSNDVPERYDHTSILLRASTLVGGFRLAPRLLQDDDFLALQKWGLAQARRLL